MTDKVDVAAIFCRHGDQYCRTNGISPEQFKVLNLIKICRTSALGGHLQQCDGCGYQRPAYNSCRNRHCPKCQTMAKEKWLVGIIGTSMHLCFTLDGASDTEGLCQDNLA